MTAKSASSIPHDHRLISRQEAAKLLGCTTQTIANWIEKGAIKGHTIDKYVFVDKQSIEALFDTASEVAQMEMKLQELKSEISKEINDREQDLVDLRTDKLTTPQKQFLRNAHRASYRVMYQLG